MTELICISCGAEFTGTLGDKCPKCGKIFWVNTKEAHESAKADYEDET